MTNESRSDTPHPVRLEKTDDRCLVIEWSDDLQQKIPFRKLRDGCRCAHCIDKQMETLTEKPDGEKKLSNALPVLSLAETQPLDVVSMHPVGNYAYNIRFTDGHSSGIYTFELLRSLE